MIYDTEGTLMQNDENQDNLKIERYLNPSDINISSGYSIEVFAQGLDSPISIFFTEEGVMLLAESGLASGDPKVLKLVEDHFEVIAEGFKIPITGINYYKDDIYVSHKGYVTVLKSDGARLNLVTGLPSNGDYYNYRVVIGPDNKMYFGQGTATNSGVVGVDNTWVYQYPFFHEFPGEYILLKGQNFETNNMLLPETSRKTAYTGAFSSYGVPNMPYESRKGIVRASGSILRANLDGTDLELIAWGLRNPSFMKFDEANRLFVSNNGFEVRGSRPIANSPDEFLIITAGVWYGWPDYSAGEPVTLQKFKPEGGVQPEFLLASHPNIPPRPFATFPANSAIMGFDFNYNYNFGPYGDVYIAEFGSRGPRTIGGTSPYAGTGQRISKIDINTGVVSTFAINKSGFPASVTSEGGFERPAEVVFGPDGAMYILDIGMSTKNDPNIFVPNTGVIWRITRNS